MLKPRRIVFLAAALLLPLSLLAQAPAASTATAPKKAPIGGSEVTSIVATVEAIDQTARTVTLKGPDGNYVTVNVPEAVERFKAMKVGDKVNIKYYEAIAIDVHKAAAGAPPADKVEGGIEKKEGAKPAGVATRKITMTVTIQAIDPKAPSVTVKTSDGHVSSFRVQDPKNLEGVKVGDRVVVTYTEALAVQVTEPKS